MRNWAGNLDYRARRLVEPRSVEELQELVRASNRFRVLGSRHSFNAIADTTGDLVSLARLPRVIEADAAAGTLAVDGGARYGDVVPALDAVSLGLHNLASLPHISIAGACATATHGSGIASQGLAAAVTGMEVVRTDGELVTFDRETDPETLPGLVVSLGAMGVVTRLTLRAEPFYRVAQVVYDALPLEAVRRHFDELESSGDSVSLFTTWSRDVIDQVWVKRRLPADGEPEPFPDALFGTRRATGRRHPVPGIDPAACTEQDGIPGPWHARLPHFRLDHTPSAGAELQSEYFVDRPHASAAFEALHALRTRLTPLVFVSEVRTIAADDLWLSPTRGRDVVAFHFTWRPLVVEVAAMLPVIEAALHPFEARPHWGKLFAMPPEVLATRYPALPDASALAAQLDPDGKLRNAFTDRYLYGNAR
jgi:alditol oxidase